MSATDIKQISDVLLRCPHPCNFLVFGLTPEILLWRALNHNGRTVFIDENRYYATYIEKKYPEIEAYDVVGLATVDIYPIFSAHLVSWEVVARGKWWWRFHLEEDSLWHKVIKSIYGLQENKWDAGYCSNLMCPDQKDLKGRTHQSGQ